MVAPQLHVTPNLHGLAPTSSPHTRRLINLIASAPSGTLATVLRRFCVHARTIIRTGVVLRPCTIWSK